MFLMEFLNFLKEKSRNFVSGKYWEPLIYYVQDMYLGLAERNFYSWASIIFYYKLRITTAEMDIPRFIHSVYYCDLLWFCFHFEACFIMSYFWYVSAAYDGIKLHPKNCMATMNFCKYTNEKKPF